MTRCRSTYPGPVTLRGRPIRCELPKGHADRHAHSYAARYWDDPDPQYPEPCGVCDRVSRSCTFGAPRLCLCWTRGIPCG